MNIKKHILIATISIVILSACTSKTNQSNKKTYPSPIVAEKNGKISEDVRDTMRESKLYLPYEALE